MNKKVITVLALAAGIAAYIYSKKKNRAEKVYDTMNNAWQSVDSGVENIFS